MMDNNLIYEIVRDLTWGTIGLSCIFFALFVVYLTARLASFGWYTSKKQVERTE